MGGEKPSVENDPIVSLFNKIFKQKKLEKGRENKTPENGRTRGIEKKGRNTVRSSKRQRENLKAQLPANINSLSQAKALSEKYIGKRGIKEAEILLKQKGYLRVSTANSTYDKNTLNAVVAFQKAAGLKVDGLIGKQTLRALRRAGGKNETPKERSIFSKLFGRKENQSMSKSKEVPSFNLSAAKEYIIRKYPSRKQRAGIARVLQVRNTPTDIAKRVAQFQKKNGLAVDGKPGANTVKAIKRAYGKFNKQAVQTEKSLLAKLFSRKEDQRLGNKSSQIFETSGSRNDFEKSLKKLPNHLKKAGYRLLSKLKPYERANIHKRPVQIFSSKHREGAYIFKGRIKKFPIIDSPRSLFGKVQRINGFILADRPHIDSSNGGNSKTVKGCSFLSNIAAGSGGKWVHGVARYRMPGQKLGKRGGKTLGCVGIDANLAYKIGKEFASSGLAKVDKRENRRKITRYKMNQPGYAYIDTV